MAAARKNSQRTPEPEDVPVVDISAPMETPLLLEQVMTAFRSASPEQQTEMSKLFPTLSGSQRPMTLEEKLALHRTSLQNQRRELDAQMVVQSVGSVSHSPGFEPMPPEHVTELGPNAVKQWTLNWYEGKTGMSFEQFRREFGAKNAGLVEQQVAEVEAHIDNPGAILRDVTTAEGGGMSYLSMEHDATAAGV